MNRFLLFLCFLGLSLSISAQYTTLESQIKSIIKNKKATVGVAVLFDGKDLVAVNNDNQYPMQSVFKLPLAMAVLDYMEKNNLSMNAEVTIKKSDLMENTHSPLRDKYPEGNITLPISELLKYSVSQSDNNACDILFDYVGGPTAVDKYMKGIGMANIAITCTERAMHAEPDRQYNNWITPTTAVMMIEKVREKDFYSPTAKEFLEKTLIETTTGPKKIKGYLPEDIIVGHKTGTSGRNAAGLKGADNDIGFVLLPDGSGYSIAILIKDSMEDDKTNENMIARISRVVFENYIQKDL